MISSQRHILGWFFLALFFFTHYFVRISPSLMSVEWMQTFSISISRIGLISSLYFLTYTFAQLPVGYLIKIFPMRVIVPTATLGCAAMAWGLSLSTSYFSALSFLIAYAFFGAFGFVSATTYASRYIPQYASLLVGMTQSIGMAGGFLATNAITQALTVSPWQHIIQICALSLAALSVLITLAVPSEKLEAKVSSDNNSTKSSSGAAIYTSFQTWTNALYAGFVYFPLMVLTEGGLGPALLRSIHQLPREEIAFAISMIFVAWTIGGPIAGGIADRYGKVAVMRFSALAGLITAGMAIFLPMGYVSLCLCLFVFGITNTGIVGCYSIAAEMHGEENASVSIAIANMATVLIGSVLGGILPTLLEKYGHATFQEGVLAYGASDYQYIFGSAVVVCTILGYVCASLTKDVVAKK